MRQNFLMALVRSHVLEGHNPAFGENHHLPRIRDTRAVRIIKRIVQRSPEIWIPWSVAWVRVRCVVNVSPGLASTRAHVADNFTVGRTPRQPHSGSRHAGANLSLAN